MTAFADHGPDGSGALAIVLRPGNAGSDTAADYIEATGSPWPSCLAGCAVGY